MTHHLSFPLRFDQFMAYALYNEEHGYYTKGDKHIGKKGDFFTSVSVGPLFGSLLAERFYRTWIDLNKPTSFSIIELGANDGALALDILQALQQSYPNMAEATQYIIIEPLEKLRSIQRQKTQGKVTIVHSATEITPGPGIVFGNELFDAFPVRLIINHQKCWHERYVDLPHSNDSSTQIQDDYCWKDVPLTPQPKDLPPASNFPENYTTEWQTSYPSFWNEISPILTSGLFLFIDYGHDEATYYHPGRTNGTLKTFHKHCMGENPLELIGEQDITYDVNFTATASAAKQSGLSPHLFSDQAHWLTSLAVPILLEMEKNTPSTESLIKFTTQFQTLTHPSQMGTRFHVLEFVKNMAPTPFLLNPQNNRITSLIV